MTGDKEFAVIGRRLQSVRKHLGFKRVKMSNTMGISPLTYTRLEQGDHLPTTKSLMALHQRAGISLEWLLFESGPMLYQVPVSLSPEMIELTSLMKKIPLLYHSIMMHFQQLKIEHKNFIRESLEGESPSPEA
jgi:transcriptional regulator with XRE-family HTH domain